VPAIPSTSSRYSFSRERVLALSILMVAFVLRVWGLTGQGVMGGLLHQHFDFLDHYVGDDAAATLLRRANR
jgi:hypothetical protein